MENQREPRKAAKRNQEKLRKIRKQMNNHGKTNTKLETQETNKEKARKTKKKQGRKAPERNQEKLRRNKKTYIGKPRKNYKKTLESMGKEKLRKTKENQ